jgi:acyl-CoA dehydrogenase
LSLCVIDAVFSIGARYSTTALSSLRSRSSSAGPRPVPVPDTESVALPGPADDGGHDRSRDHGRRNPERRLVATTQSATTLPTLVPPPVELPPGAGDLRRRVRAFVAEEVDRGAWVPRADAWLSGWDERFSRELGRRGWLGMTIPVEYGGHGATALERYVVTEELLAAGAPVAAHWIADRQVAPALLRYGSEEQRRLFLPGIAAGEISFALGMSEPDAGSDLAGVRTRAEKVDGGWALTGTKVWTSGAHRARAVIVLARSGPRDPEHRHRGLTQFFVDTRSPGLDIRPIRLLTGAHHFNEVVFDGTFVPDGMVLGEVGEGWRQVTSELAFERSGPERFLSVFPLLVSLIDELARSGGGDAGTHREIGALVTRTWTLRRMSLAVAGALASGQAPDLAAAVVKDLGTRYENEVVDVARRLAPCHPDPEAEGGLARLLADAVLHAPGFTLRGGTNEVLRGIVARGLGLR